MKKIGSILVVDDEMPIREALKNFPWAEYGFHLLGAARHGKDALRICEQKGYPDILLTDITMPVMNGLELIERLKMQGAKTQYIILTCHQDFEYARQAISYQVISYLLKGDLYKEEMKNCIRRAADVIREIKIKEDNKQRKKLHKALQNADEKEIEQILKLLGWDFECCEKDYFLILKNLSVWADEWENIFGRFFQEEEAIKSWMNVSPYCYAVQVHEGSQEAVQHILERMSEKCEGLQTVAIHSGMKKYLAEGRKTNCWKNYLFYYPEKIIIQENEIQLSKKWEECVAERYEILLKKRGGEEAFEAWAREEYLRPKDLKRLMTEFLQGEEKNWYEKIEESADIRELKDIYEEIYGKQREPIRYEIAKALDILHSEYRSNLTLNNVAERVQLSPAYFSKLFSDTMGENMSNYLRTIRMEKAVELIQHSNLKVYQVAEAVGIPNYRYFAASFKSYTGFTPQDMKKTGTRERDGKVR